MLVAEIARTNIRTHNPFNPIIVSMTQSPRSPPQRTGRTISSVLGIDSLAVGKIESSKVPFAPGGHHMIHSLKEKRCHPLPPSLVLNGSL